MAITEIDSTADAKQRLQQYFLSGAVETSKPRMFLEAHIDEYAQLAFFLSDKPAFELNLQFASYCIWLEYNKPEIMVAANRYTNAIASVGRRYGLSGQNSYVLINEASSLFGELLRGGHLWKDSFAPGHGEFAHSYQWISWALAMGHKMIAPLYKGTAVMSWLPMFVKAEKEIELRRVYLWEWLVDCTRYQLKFDNQIHAAAEKYLQRIGSLHGQKNAEPWTRDLWWTDVESRVYGLVKEYAKANVLCLDRYRNANNITDLIKSKEGWFIQAYETRRQRSIQKRENEQKVEAIHRIIGVGHAPTEQQKKDWGELKPFQIASKMAGLGRNERNPYKNLQPIDIGKNVLLHHYTTKQNGVTKQEQGVPVRFDRTPPVGGSLKTQVRKTFHGEPGLMNAEVD